MAKTNFKTVDDYIASQPKPVQAVLTRVRSAIRNAVPDAKEVLSYQIPAYKLDGVVLYLAAWKQHYSLYPVTAPVVEAFKDDLLPYELSQGTIRFPFTRAVPVKLIERIATFRARENTEHARANAERWRVKKRQQRQAAR
jgi:uncharacterized protein YdhG (YjbR/CyaY superfamily)